MQNTNSHPEKWYIVATEDNYDELEAWRQTVATSYLDSFKIGHCLLSDHPGDSSYFYGGSVDSLRYNSDFNGYQEITIEQFREITNSLPEHWYIKATEENIDELNRWRLSKRTINAQQWDHRFVPGATLLSKHPEEDDGSYFWLKHSNWAIKHPEYKPITLEQFRQITNSNKMKHPEHWYIVATENNYSELEAWRQTVTRGTYTTSFNIGHPLLSKHPMDDSYYYGGSVDSLKIDHKFNHYQEITIEQFRAITNSKPMSKTIQIPHSLLIEYYEAATTPQKEYLTKHFKLDGTTTDEAIRGLYELACGGWKPKIKANHPECFPEDSKYFDFSEHTNKYGYGSIVSSDVAHSLGLCRDFIQVKAGGKYSDRSFYLTSGYDWELVKDAGATILIPTKK